jgi:hypothetical protein
LQTNLANVVYQAAGSPPARGPTAKPDNEPGARRGPELYNIAKAFSNKVVFQGSATCEVEAAHEYAFKCLVLKVKVTIKSNQFNHHPASSPGREN